MFMITFSVLLHFLFGYVMSFTWLICDLYGLFSLVSFNSHNFKIKFCSFFKVI